MISVTKTTDKNIITEIVTDKRLWELTNGQDQTSERVKYIPDIAFEYLVVKDEGHLIGLFSIRKISHKVLEGHIRILPSYWGSKKALQAAEAGFQWARDNTEALNVMSYVPSNCHHVMAFCAKLGFKVRGSIPDGIIYNHELVDLFILNIEIRS